MAEPLTPTGPQSLTPTGRPSLTPTGRVLLGMIARGKRTGYEMKQLVDRATRHFWAASYGQIYPELRRLEQQGLVQSTPEPSGGRARTAYELTDAGREALLEWLASDGELFYELRDEGMLKLFFSDVAPGQRLQNVRAMRAMYQRKLDQLSALKADNEHEMPIGPGLTLDMGLTITRCLIDWCEATERRLADAEVQVEV
jgi:PadR family transcriptional regulator, regulatory protein AphA